MRFLFLTTIIMLVCVVVVQAAVLNEPYVGVSEASELLNAAANATCNGKGTCADSVYATVTSKFFELTDGSAAVTSVAQLRNTTGTNERVLSLTFTSMSSLRNGIYYLELLNYDAGTTFIIYPYMDANNVDTSLSVTATLASATTWYEINVDSIVRKAWQNFGVIKLRAITTGTATTGQRIAEAYLKRPVTIQDLQFVQTGSTQVEINQRASAVWMVFSTIPGVQLQNVSCTFQNIVNDSVVPLPYVVSISTSNSTDQTRDPGKFEVYYVANSSLGVAEGMQLELYCNVTVEGVTFTNVEQIIYVNRLSSIWSAVVAFQAYIAEILGFMRNEVAVLQTSFSSGAASQALVKVMQNKQPYSLATCNVSLLYPNLTSYVVNQSMSYVTAGVYKYEWIAPTNIDYMVASATCRFNNTNGNVSWSAVDILNARDFPVNVNATQLFEGTPSLLLLQGGGYAGSVSQILVQLLVGSNSVSNAVCNVTVYYPTNMTKIVANQQMSYSGDDGMYNFSWVPPAVVDGVYPARVSCQGGSLGSMIVQASTGVRVTGGVTMQVIS